MIMTNGSQFFYTSFGEVYHGIGFKEIGNEGYTTVVPIAKLASYQQLDSSERVARALEHGWVLNDNIIQGTIAKPNFKPPKNTLSAYGSWDSKYDRRIMFVFGAGASAHCVTGLEKEAFYKDSLRPPVGPGLFDKRFENLYNSYKGVKQSLHLLQGEDLGVDVELLFEQEWIQVEKYNNQAILSRHISIQYYLQNLLRDISNRVIDRYYSHNLYAKLAYKLQLQYAQNAKRKFAFVSFNQDTILEYFLGDQFGTSISNMDQYCEVNHNPYCIFKPHGSWNWAWEFPKHSDFKKNTAHSLFEGKKNFHNIYYELLGDHISMVDWNSYGHHWALNKHFIGKYTVDKSKIQLIDGTNLDGQFPALLLPYRDKDEFTMPLSHFYQMDFYLSFIETLVIIGWKGNEQAFTDRLLNNALRISKVIIVDPCPEIVKKHLAPLLKKQSPNIKLFKTFEEFVLSDFEQELY